MTFTELWSQLEPIGRWAETGGYRRYSWTAADADCRAWFAEQARSRGLRLETDRNGNQWAWWNPSADASGTDAAEQPALAIGSHLDSVPDGGAFDGPLGVICALAAVGLLRKQGWSPARPVLVANFADEEGARFGVACAGSRLLTGALDADRARSLRDVDGWTMAEGMAAAGLDPQSVGPDPLALQRIGTFVELHVEQGRGLVGLGAPVGVASAIWPHGRWRFDFAGEANHAGTTRLADRRDPMITYAGAVLAAREAAERHEALATFGKVQVTPNGVNAIPSQVTAWLDARGPSAPVVRGLVDDLTATAGAMGAGVREESWTDETSFDTRLRSRLSALLAGPDGREAPILATGAGHDAGILSLALVETAMLFVRNPTGISHSPEEFAEESDCVKGVEALASVMRELAS